MHLDELHVFAIALAHCLALQVIKDLQTITSIAHLLPTFLLATAIAWCHVASSEYALLSLATSALLVLGMNGSQSNHVVLEAIVVLAVLITAPRMVQFGIGESRHAVATARRRSEWAGRLAFSLRVLLGVLYAMTGFAKLNDAWHDPQVSCCVQMFVAFAATFADVRLLPPPLLKLLPYGATAFELGFPLVLLGVHLHLEPHGRRSMARAVLRGLTVSGAAFHVVIALPPPPMSVYPFSMLMAPIYILALLPEEVGAAARIVAGWPRAALARAAAVLAAAAAWACYRPSTHFEYPPYFSWELGVLWTLCAFGGIAAVALLVDVPHVDEEAASSASPSQPTAPMSTTRRLLALLPALLTFAISSGTYLGIRNYPSFAMFSNLLLEGGSSNHWLVGPTRHTYDAGHAGDGTVWWWQSLSPAEYGPDDAIEIVQTNLPAIRDLQINLAPLLPPAVLSAFASTNVSAEFYITPPKWPYAPPEAFRPFAVPVVEVRRRLAVAAGEVSDFFVRYRTVVDGRALGRVREYRRRRGVRTPASDARLEAPLSRWRAMLHKYRAFSVGAAPCRH